MPASMNIFFVSVVTPTHTYPGLVLHASGYIVDITSEMLDMSLREPHTIIIMCSYMLLEFRIMLPYNAGPCEHFPRASTS